MDLDVIVPEGCFPGSELVLEEQGQQFFVVVPQDCGPGDHFLVTLPLVPPPEVLEVIVPDGCSAGEPFVVTAGQAQFEVICPPNCGPGSATPPPPSRRSPPLELSDDSSEEEAGPRFAVGAPAEVLRTDGLYTLATVTDYDADGDTYTVQLADGRCKYFVEPSDLRLPRFLLLSTAHL